jgi:hypothetical protein
MDGRSAENPILRVWVRRAGFSLEDIALPVV